MQRFYIICLGIASSIIATEDKWVDLQLQATNIPHKAQSHIDAIARHRLKRVAFDWIRQSKEVQDLAVDNIKKELQVTQFEYEGLQEQHKDLFNEYARPISKLWKKQKPDDVKTVENIVDAYWGYHTNLAEKGLQVLYPTHENAHPKLQPQSNFETRRYTTPFVRMVKSIYNTQYDTKNKLQYETGAKVWQSNTQ